jgi:hypothetical protein
MQKSIPIGIFLGLAACGAAVTTSNNSAEAVTQGQRRNAPPRDVGFENFSDRPGGMAGCFDPRLSGYPRRAAEAAGGRPCGEGERGGQSVAGQSGDGWSGNYSGRFDGGRGTVEISSLGRSSYLVEVSTVGQGTGCSGGASGTGSASGNRMTLAMPDPFSGGQCRITMDRNGGTLAVHEDNCLGLHGAQCNFEGSVTRRAGADAAAPPPRTASAAAGSSIDGIWVKQGDYCASGDPIGFGRDGRYSSEGVAGRWLLAGDRVTVLYREIDLESGAAVGPQQRFAYRLVRVNANEIRLNADRYRRCPAGGGEPWQARGQIQMR